MSKGFGTAVGELPPYFMARGARLSDRHEEELEELEDILEAEKATTSSGPLAKQTLTFQKRMELHLHRLILRAGFIGILLCASVGYAVNRMLVLLLMFVQLSHSS
ncbi:Vacuole membrane protein 1 [Fasciolopsis buskii]|uniref:Vacuole membrane protein 1 n=1 Tax=Fasciolopsis buskii TaxID=27845 RepID=A0A8E0RS61_9TREM|nr:Vacuole membrane protein 1 [Fasciolopsis buski]